MKVLVISQDTVGEGLALALRCVEAGHSVRFWLPKNANQSIGMGFKGLEKINDWITSVPWANLIIPTGNHSFMGRLDAIRAAGKSVFGPSSKSARLEINRQAGLTFLEQHGIEVPAYKTFATLQKAQEHVKKTEARFVFKTAGDEDDKSLSYCGKDAADMYAWIGRKISSGQSFNGPFLLQEFIKGTEFAASCWVGRDGFVGQFAENFERKKLMPGDCGPNTGEMGSIIKYVSSSKLADEMLRPIEKDLVKLGHFGDFDVNCIVDENGKPWPLEFTARCGWPSTNIQTSLHKGDPAQWMVDAMHGKNTLQVSPKVAVGVVIAQPDFPYSTRDEKETDGIPIYGVTDENRRYLWPQSVRRSPQPVMKGEHIEMAPTWTTAGDYLMVVTGCGRTVDEAGRRAYQTVKEIHVPDMIYRIDLHKDLREKLPQLHAFGYAREFRYDDMDEPLKESFSTPLPLKRTGT